MYFFKSLYLIVEIKLITIFDFLNLIVLIILFPTSGVIAKKIYLYFLSISKFLHFYSKDICF